MRSFLLLLALLAVALPATAAEDTTVDERLTQQITVNEKGDRLDRILQGVRKQTGVVLLAESPMSVTVAVCRYEGTLQGFMNALAKFFSVDRDHRAWWCPSLAGQYRLQRDEKTRSALDTLRRENQSRLVTAIDQAVRDGHPWLKHFGMLLEEERLAVYSGGEVTHKSTFFGGQTFIREFLGEQNAQFWGDDVDVTFSMAGPSPLTRKFSWRIREGNEETGGQELVEGVYVGQICPMFAPESQQREWRARYGDPTPRDEKQVIVSQKRDIRPGDKPQEILRRDALWRIAEKADLNLIADDYGQLIAENTLPHCGSVAELLDDTCKFTWGADGHGSFWRQIKADGSEVYLVRSLAWVEEEITAPAR
jgi:hypothetical protein